MKFSYECPPYEHIRKFYGAAYINWRTGRAVCFPIPLNLIVRFFQDLKFWVKNPSRASVQERVAELESQVEYYRKALHRINHDPRHNFD